MKNSFYGNIFSENSEQLDFSAIIDRIQKMMYADQVTKIRMLVCANKKDEANELKKKLPVCTHSDTFEAITYPLNKVGSGLKILTFGKCYM